MFTLKDIKGAAVEKKNELIKIIHGDKREMVEYPTAKGFNQAIDAQSSVRLRFNREKLAEILWSKGYATPWDEVKKDTRKLWKEVVKTHYEIADAIIAADKDIVEVDV